MRVLTPSAVRVVTGQVDRRPLPSAVDDRLYFAQVREDPLLEIDALDAGPNDSLVVVGSGGCTALSLLAAGAGQVTAVDVNRTQNHLIELKLGAVSILSRNEALAFLGACDATSIERLDAYSELRRWLTWRARTYWDGRLSMVGAGVIGAGVTERFIRSVVLALRLLVHRRAHIERMLECESIEEQRTLFAREWYTARWRMFFRLLLNRGVFRRAYDPTFFAHLERPSFADHFRRRAEHALTQLAVRDNYFLHHMLTGRYPVDVANGVPPYLGDTAAVSVDTWRERLTLVDGSVTDYLRTLPDESVSGFAISNICEWLAPDDIDALFAEIVRTAMPNATLCFRNFVGWTEVPAHFQHVVVEDRALGERMIERDRSVVQRRIAVCRINAARNR